MVPQYFMEISLFTTNFIIVKVVSLKTKYTWKPFYALISCNLVVSGSREENETLRKGQFLNALKH